MVRQKKKSDDFREPTENFDIPLKQEERSRGVLLGRTPEGDAVFLGKTEVFESEKDKLIRKMQEKIEWMSANQMSLGPSERARKWEEVWDLDRQIKRLP